LLSAISPLLLFFFLFSWPGVWPSAIHSVLVPSCNLTITSIAVILSSSTLARCVAKCDSLVSKGCIGFVASGASDDVDWCYMRKLDTNQTTCSQAFAAGYSGSLGVFTRDATCSFSPGWRPGMTPSNATVSASVM
jgi:hypothetical protein